MNDVDPQAWLADVLDKIANRHPMSKIDELLPWAYINNGGKRQSGLENTAYAVDVNNELVWGTEAIGAEVGLSESQAFTWFEKASSPPENSAANGLQAGAS